MVTLVKSAPKEFTVKSHFEGKDPVVRRIYDQLLAALMPMGRFTEDPKKTSIHLVNATALAGIATRKAHIVLTIKSDRKLISPRFHKIEQTSPNRFHQELRLTSPADVDQELTGWLGAAYDLSS